MDCFFHDNVPSVSRCTTCGKGVCATCRDDAGTCPSCRLAAKIDAAGGERARLGGRVGPSYGPQPGPSFGPEAGPGYGHQYSTPPPAAQPRAHVAQLSDPPESRALVALGYPIWPLALLAIFDRKQSAFLRRHAYQALGFNIGMAGFSGLMALLINIPFLGFSPAVLLPLLVPLFLVMSIIYGVRTWQGEEVRVPILSDWLDERLPTS